MSEHNVIGPSSHYRYRNCPGSVNQSEGLRPSESSEYALEGSAAHALGEYCLTQGGDPYEYVGASFPKYPAVEIDEEMARFITAYIEVVKSYADKNSILLVEERMSLSLSPDIKRKLFGTGDAVAWKPDVSTVVVIDLKYGAGVGVDAEGNLQLLDYGVMALERFPEAENFILVIFQPRTPFGEPKKVMRISQEDLIKYRETELIPDIRATEDPNASLKRGDWCRWCPAGQAGKCPKLKLDMEEAVNGGQNGITVQENIIFKSASEMTEQELARAVNLGELFLSWHYANKKEEEARVLSGRSVPGRKLVRARADRRYKKDTNEIDVMTALESADIFVPRKLKSFTTLEKEFPKKKDVIATFLEKLEGRLIVVNEDDKRPAVNVLCNVIAELGLSEEDLGQPEINLN